MLKPNQRRLIALLLFLFAFGIRAYQLDRMPTQNDEQLWLARAYAFVHSMFNSEPETTPLTTIYSDNGYVDVFAADKALVPEQYPFTIHTLAHHPGIPPTLMIGLSYVFLADGSHEASLDLLPTIVAIKLPNVFVGSLLVFVVYFGASYLINDRVGLVAAGLIAVSPLMIGYSRFGRIDMAAALFTTCMFFSYAVLIRQTHRKSQIKWAISAGAFAGLGMATIPYAVYIVPIFVLMKILLSDPLRSNGIRRFLPDAYDLLLLIVWITVYLMAFPNLWANPIAGFGLWLDNVFLRPHLTAEESRTLYFEYIALTTVPTTILLMIGGTWIGLKKYRNETIVLLAWIGWFLLLLSIPSGGKPIKNILQLSVPFSILAGVTIDWLAVKLTQYRKSISYETVFRVLLGSQLMIGLAVTAYWWPLPHLYILPGASINLEDGTGFAGSHGMKLALDYALENSPIEPQKFIARSGRNNLLFYLPEDMLEYQTRLGLEQSDWLIVLPKIYKNAENTWYYDVEPTHIVAQHQIELAYMFYLPDFFPREMFDTSSPMMIYDNGIELYDLDWVEDDRQLVVTSLWGEMPEAPYGFSIQLFDEDNNKVVQGDFLLPVEIKQTSTMDIKTLAPGDYRMDLIVYDLATGSSVGGHIVASDSSFDRAYPAGTITVSSVNSTLDDD